MAYRFSLMMDLDEETNIPDAIESAKNRELVGIVDEKEGGIIAYAIGDKHAVLILKALQKHTKDKRTAYPD